MASFTKKGITRREKPATESYKQRDKITVTPRSNSGVGATVTKTNKATGATRSAKKALTTTTESDFFGSGSYRRTSTPRKSNNEEKAKLTKVRKSRKNEEKEKLTKVRKSRKKID